MGENLVTFEEAVTRWSAEREMLGYVEPHTARKSKQKASLLCPWIGATPIDAIEPSTVSDALVELAAHGGRSGKGLSSATLRAAHLACAQAADWAIEKGLAAGNPIKAVKRPKANYRQSRYLTSAQASELVTKMSAVALAPCDDDMQEGSFAIASCIAISTGLRRGEIFALKWEDVNFDLLRISVSKAIKADGSLGLPKSGSSIRSVAFGEGLGKLLLRSCEHRAHNPGSYVVCSNGGGRASLNAFEHWWRSWADSNGFEGLRFHELRHTHATLLISGGTDVKTVQMRLGHASAEITMSCYAHVIPISDTVAASKLDDSLFA